METKRNSGNNETTNLELVLEQFANEQKSQTKSLNELVSVVNSLSNIVVNFKEEVQKPSPVSDSTDAIFIQEIVRKAVIDIRLFVAAQQQKPILKKYQLLLFPEQDARKFYKIVFGRWFLWLAVMLCLTFIYRLSLRWSDNQKEIELQMQQSNKLNKSWNSLYLKAGISLKKLMDSVYYKAEGTKN
jgi:hypothetical protein